MQNCISLKCVHSFVFLLAVEKSIGMHLIPLMLNDGHKQAHQICMCTLRKKPLSMNFEFNDALLQKKINPHSIFSQVIRKLSKFSYSEYQKKCNWKVLSWTPIFLEGLFFMQQNLIKAKYKYDKPLYITFSHHSAIQVSSASYKLRFP